MPYALKTETLRQTYAQDVRQYANTLNLQVPIQLVYLSKLFEAQMGRTPLNDGHHNYSTWAHDLTPSRMRNVAYAISYALKTESLRQAYAPNSAQMSGSLVL